jgi:predicted ATPase
MGRGYARAALGQPEDGLVEMEEGWAVWQAMGAKASNTHHAIWLADTCRRADRIEAAFTWVDVAAEHARVFGERDLEAEIHRLHGELLLEKGATVEAEACLRRSIDIARRQKAKAFELRTATVLARHLNEMGQRQAASELLAPIYGWFTEGFDTPDMKAARQLLAQIA